MKTDFDRVMLCLSVEVTRRCNMNCNFCARGPSQNIDISHEIIDKIISETEHFFACGLRLHGGEPLLAYDEIEYLFHSIIEHQIPISYIVLFTNGYIKDERYFSLVKMMLDYIRKIEMQYPEVADITKNYTEINEIYNAAKQKKIVFITSSYGHEYKPNFDDTINFYNDGILDEDFVIIEQYTPKGARLVLEGNARTNIKTLLGDKVDPSKIRTVSNGFYFIAESNSNTERKFINKTITVSANGNVFPGCSMSYTHVDEKPMFNILVCNGDMWDKIEEYCWEHPISIENKKFRERYEAMKLCKQNGIHIKDFDFFDYNLEDLIYTFSICNENISRKLHQKYKSLKIQDVMDLSLMIQCLHSLENKNIDEDAVKAILRYYINTITNIKDEEELELLMNKEALKAMIDLIISQN